MKPGLHTVSPGVVQRNDLVNKCWICISPSLRFSDELWVASLTCTVHVQIGIVWASCQGLSRAGHPQARIVHIILFSGFRTTQGERPTFSEQVDVQHRVLPMFKQLGWATRPGPPIMLRARFGDKKVQTQCFGPGPDLLLIAQSLTRWQDAPMMGRLTELISLGVACVIYWW